MRKKVSYKRKREGRTDYRKRLIFLKSGVPRLVIRKSNKYLTVQLVESAEARDKIILGITSQILKKHGWNFSFKNIPAAYLTGFILAKKAKLSKTIIVDFGRHPSTKGSKIYAVIKGCIDGGLKVKVGEGILPEEKKLFGEKTKQPDKINQKINEIKEKIK
ncbi:MAG: 50S ribosomal protein L18 [archaeon]